MTNRRQITLWPMLLCKTNIQLLRIIADLSAIPRRQHQVPAITDITRWYEKSATIIPSRILWRTGRHITSTSRDLLSGATDDKLRTSITDLVNILLAGDFPREVNETIFGGRLIVSEKKGGGIRPISVGYTWRRLAAKYAHRHVISRRSAELQPIQLEVGVAGGAEVAIHATRRYLKLMLDNHILVKLDFINAFNSIRRDLVLDSIAGKMPDLFVLFILLAPEILFLHFEIKWFAQKKDFNRVILSVSWVSVTPFIPLSPVSTLIFESVSWTTSQYL